jgi:hypothetical protein
MSAPIAGPRFVAHWPSQEAIGRCLSLFKVSMTNYNDNLVFLVRNTSLTPSEVNTWSYFEFEMFLHTLKEQLDKEAAEKKKQQKADMRQQASMRSQINEYMKHHSPSH